MTTLTKESAPIEATTTRKIKTRSRFSSPWTWLSYLVLGLSR